jgi:predicted nucleotidyltransferase
VRPDLDTLRLGCVQVAERLNLDLVVLFGSAARGDAGVPNDLDVGVKSAGLVDTVAVTNAFIQALGVQAVDVVDLRRADPVLLLQVARDGIALFERTSTGFAEFISLAARRFADTKKFRDAEAAYIEDFLSRRRAE